MALDSSFWIDAPSGPQWVQSTLAGSGIFRRARPSDEKLSVDGVLAIIGPTQDGDSRLAEAGITARVHVFFANTDKSQTKQWTLSSVRSVLLLLSACEGDAFFLYCSDSPALLRRRGALVLDPRCGLWRPGVEPAVLPLVTMSYSWREIPFS